MRGLTLRYSYEVRDEGEYFSEIPDMKIPGEMLKLAEHIIESKTADFEPKKFVDHYEEAVVELLRQKQSGKALGKPSGKSTAKPVGNVIDLLKQSLELSKKKVKSPSLQPAMPTGRSSGVRVRGALRMMRVGPTPGPRRNTSRGRATSPGVAGRLRLSPAGACSSPRPSASAKSRKRRRGSTSAASGRTGRAPNMCGWWSAWTWRAGRRGRCGRHRRRPGRRRR